MDFTPNKIAPNPEGQAKLILQSNGLRLIQPLFYTVDQQNLAIEQAQEYDLKNWMDNPVFDTVQFDEIHYTTNDGKNLAVDKLTLTNCMHIVSIPKNVIKTPIAGADGTVKEYIGLGDHQITLSGMLVSQHANVPPDIEMKQLIEICKAPVSVNLYSNFLAHFEIFTIVIEGEPSFSQIEATRNAVIFTINASSDKPFEVEYNDNKKQIAITSVPSFR